MKTIKIATIGIKASHFNKTTCGIIGIASITGRDTITYEELKTIYDWCIANKKQTKGAIILVDFVNNNPNLFSEEPVVEETKKEVKKEKKKKEDTAKSVEDNKIYITKGEFDSLLQKSIKAELEIVKIALRDSIIADIEKDYILTRRDNSSYNNKNKTCKKAVSSDDTMYSQWNLHMPEELSIENISSYVSTDDHDECTLIFEDYKKVLDKNNMDKFNKHVESRIKTGRKRKFKATMQEELEDSASIISYNSVNSIGYNSSNMKFNTIFRILSQHTGYIHTNIEELGKVVKKILEMLNKQIEVEINKIKDEKVSNSKSRMTKEEIEIIESIAKNNNISLNDKKFFRKMSKYTHPDKNSGDDTLHILLNKYTAN